MRPAALLSLLLPAVTLASPPPAERRDYGNFRMGASAGSVGGRMEMCLEVAPLDVLSFEGCGNGSGFLQHEPIPEVAHFRAKLRVASLAVAGLWLEPQVGLGFAELQLGEDSAGFHFTGTDPSGHETSGPEGTLALRALVPLSPGWEAVGVLSFAVAWMPHAPRLVERHATVQPTIGLSFGVGF